MFDFGNANSQQRKAIEATEGPVLITAGPGTGKTYTLVQRAIYLIQEKGIAPEQILIATFTEKAAKELITRITNELAKRNIQVNIKEMYVGTFHSLCLRIIKEHIEKTSLSKNFMLIDEFDQQYLVYRNLNRIRKLPGYKELMLSVFGKEKYPRKSLWDHALEICKYVNSMAEETIDCALLADDQNPEIVTLGQIASEYKQILRENNFLDFSGIQVETYQLFLNFPDVLEKLRTQIRYLMIDEYQDTNYIQEQLVFLLGSQNKNICVVGDDDQGLYRFRGATIRNILEFPEKFPAGECNIIHLVENYRSTEEIVNFYNSWMKDQHSDGFTWNRFRFDKQIVAHNTKHYKCPTVLRVSGRNSISSWYQQLLSFVYDLKESGKLTDLNQIAFLFSSVKSVDVRRLANFFEQHGIPVYSPRSNMYFDRDEIRLLIGCFILLFPVYARRLKDGYAEGTYKYLNQYNRRYFTECAELANAFLKNKENKNLRKYIIEKRAYHDGLSSPADYGYTNLFYQLLAFEPFRSIVNTDLNDGVANLRPARNIALFSQLICKFEYLHHISVIDGTIWDSQRRIDRNTELLFNLYLRLLMDGGIGEYEDDKEYAPSGCVSFLTIHQSKGMEFPIVVVGSLDTSPWTTYDAITNHLEVAYYKRPRFEPQSQIPSFDFMRKYYTAFSRAQDLLVLTCNEHDGDSDPYDRSTPSCWFSPFWRGLPEFALEQFALYDDRFHVVKDVQIKECLSFTSHISVYETCPIQYKFFKELGFQPVRVNGMLFGLLVHETIEDIHKAAINGESASITTETITKWFYANYNSLADAQHSYLAKAQQETALKQVLRYAECQRGQWERVCNAEMDVSLITNDYIIEGKVDLVRSSNDAYELVDFKTEPMPSSAEDQQRLDRCKRQLQLYAYLIEERTGKKVNSMHLYYTGVEDPQAATISWPYSREDILGTIHEFDSTAQKILHKSFDGKASSRKTCANCDLKEYCNQYKVT